MMKDITKDIPISEELVVESVFTDEEALMSDSDGENNAESASDVELLQAIEEYESDIESGFDFELPPSLDLLPDESELFGYINNSHRRTRSLFGLGIEEPFNDAEFPEREGNEPFEKIELCTFKSSALCSEVERLVDSETDVLRIPLVYDTVLHIVKETSYSTRALLHDPNAQSYSYAADAVDDVHVLKEITISLNDAPGQSIQFTIGFYRHFDPTTQTCNDPQPNEIVDFAAHVEYNNKSEDAPNSLLYSTFQRTDKITSLLDILFKDDNQRTFINLLASFDELDCGSQLPYGNSGRVPEMSWIMGSSFRYIGISSKAWLISLIKVISDQMLQLHSFGQIFEQPSLFASVAFYLKIDNFMVMPTAWWSDVINQDDILVSIKYIFILDCLAQDNFVEEMNRLFTEYLGESNDAMPPNVRDLRQIEVIQIIMGMLSGTDATAVQAERVARTLANEEVSKGNSVNQSAIAEDTAPIADTNTVASNEDDGAGGSKPFNTPSLEEEFETIVSSVQKK